MEEMMLKLLANLPETFIDRLMRDQVKISKKNETATTPEGNSKAIPPSKQKTGIYKDTIYG